MRFELLHLCSGTTHSSASVWIRGELAICPARHVETMELTVETMGVLEHEVFMVFLPAYVDVW